MLTILIIFIAAVVLVYLFADKASVLLPHEKAMSKPTADQYEQIDEIFSVLWDHYRNTNDQVDIIHNLLSARGEKIVNDHIAIRTFNHPSVSVDVLGGIFTSLGYKARGEYHFEKKKLHAKHYECIGRPSVFISELKVEEFSPWLQKEVNKMLEGVKVEGPEFLWSRPWDMISHYKYKKILAESEYAAWVATFGYCANHFTISVNELSDDFNHLPTLNKFLEKNGIELNKSGGKVKGSPDQVICLNNVKSKRGAEASAPIRTWLKLLLGVARKGLL